MTSTVTPTITEKYVELSHGKTRYFEAGSGEPLILVHGANIYNSGAVWAHIMHPLAEHFRVLAPDCLNWGPSDVFQQEFSFAYLVDQIREFMDALGIEKANLAGHSMGGWIATLFAYESPDRLNKVVLSSAGGVETRPLSGMVEWQPPSEEQVRKTMGARVPTLPPEMDGDKLVQEVLDKINNPEHVQGFQNVMRHMTNPMTRSRYNTVRRLPHIKTPSLILWGTDDHTNDVRMAKVMQDGIPNSKIVTFEGAGHGTFQERPEEWTRAVIEFLGA
jgi:pimeloyl-ACP methyl ester carboxylesterase